MRYIIKYTEAIKKLLPTAKFGLSGNDENSIQITSWEDETLTKPTHTAIKDKMAELETAYDNNEYQRDRAKAYAQIKEQLDLLYHDMTAGKLDNTGEWHKHIKKVKDDNPKE
jgi:chromosome segregation ATPase|tara:strand:+ start:385 stop:720 length:336 start_codon:yes stop_codon:yes gene_type:complete